eukprot:gene9582-biopygen8039
MASSRLLKVLHSSKALRFVFQVDTGSVPLAGGRCIDVDQAYRSGVVGAALTGSSIRMRCPSLSSSSNWPDQTAQASKPIRLIVPYAAGGGTDGIARIVAQGVSERLGQGVVVDNNGSAGGNVATQHVANAEPDGYTILMANQGPMVVNPHLFRNVKIDPLKAFA